MADKPLKSITFPDLPDRYTIPQIDANLETSGMAADAKATGDLKSAISERTSELFWFKDRTNRTLYGVDLTFDNNSTVAMAGTSTASPALAVNYGNDDKTVLAVGESYVLDYKIISQDSSDTGSISLRLHNGSSYITLTKGVAFQVSEPSYPQIVLTKSKVYDRKMVFHLTRAADYNEQWEYTPLLTAKDTVARESANAANNYINEYVGETGNLFHFDNLESRTSYTVQLEFPNEYSIKLTGTMDSHSPGILICGDPDNPEIPAGTYIYYYYKKDQGNDDNGTFSMQCKDGENDYVFVSSKTPFTVTDSAYLRLKLSSLTTYDVTYVFKLYKADNEKQYYVPRKTAVDTVARSDIDNYALHNKLLVETFCGALDSGTGSPTNNYGSFYKYRKTDLIEVDGSVRFTIPFYEKLSYFNVYEYGESNGQISYNGLERDIVPEEYVYYNLAYSNTKYIRLVFVLTNSSDDSIDENLLNLEVSVNSKRVLKNPDVRYQDVIKFNYPVSRGVYTSGNLVLPPNYSVYGEKAPLVVVLHGTSSMNVWDERIGSNSDASTRYLVDYLANEGFAVFDCYPFTSKYYSASNQVNAAPVSVNKRAYVEGIRFVCKHYNVDINNVCMYAMSLGGNMAYWFMSQKEIPIRAIAMLSVSHGWYSLIFREFFLQKAGRSFIVNALHLENESDAEYFINTDDGVDDQRCVQFVENHLDKFINLSWIYYDTHGATRTDHYNWLKTPETNLPTWMSDLEIPNYPSGWQSSGVPSLVNHPELTKYTAVPVKFWQAFDDVNTCAHATYTVYTWLRNGGSNVEWRTLPNNTGAHHAVDTSEYALKQSGTTRLGISYTDIATAYVEMADFFWDNIV